jgi:hypothetical protein
MSAPQSHASWRIGWAALFSAGVALEFLRWHQTGQLTHLLLSLALLPMAVASFLNPMVPDLRQRVGSPPMPSRPLGPPALRACLVVIGCILAAASLALRVAG